jgi:hypothetical protein
MTPDRAYLGKAVRSLFATAIQLFLDVRPSVKRIVFFLYGVFCHLLFLVVFAYLAAFLGNVLVGNSIDHPATGDSTSVAIAIDLALILLFSVQHSVMARPGFKRLWTQIVPTQIERSTYVLLSCGVTALLLWQWRPIPVVYLGGYWTSCLVVAHPAVRYRVTRGTRRQPDDQPLRSIWYAASLALFEGQRI